MPEVYASQVHIRSRNISSGSIFFDGNLISENSDKQKVLNKLGVCFQSNALFDSYNVWENIAFKSLYNESYPNIFNLKKLAWSG